MTIANGILDASALAALGAALAFPPGEYGVAGDSILEGGYAGASASKRVMHRSGGRFRQRRSYAAGGKRTDEILATQVPLLIASGLRLAIVCGGTNDIEQGVSEATIRANLIQTWTALRLAGIEFVDVGPLPRSNSMSLAVRRADHELWRSLYCARTGIKHVNAMLLLATPSGGYAAGQSYDDVHPNAAASDILADAIIAALDRRAVVSPLVETLDRAAAPGVVYANAVGFGGVAAALPSAWFGGGTTGATYSVIVPDSGQPNRWLRSSFDGVATDSGFNATSRNLADLGMATGHTVPSVASCAGSLAARLA